MSTRSALLSCVPAAPHRPRRWSRPPAWVAALLLTVVAGAAYLAAGEHPLLRGLLSLGLNAAVLLVLVVVAHRHPRVGALRSLLAGEAVYLVSNLAFHAAWADGQVAPFPSLVDLGFFVAYGLFALAMVQMLRASGRLVVADSLDLLVVVLAVTIGVWQVLVAPRLSGAGLAASLTLFSYPALQMLLAGLGIWLALTSRPVVPHLLLGGWVLGELVGDAYLAKSGLDGTFSITSAWNLCWLSSWGLLAAMALHPRVDELWNGATSTRPPTFGGRLLLLGFAMLLPTVLALLVPRTGALGRESFYAGSVVSMLTAVLVLWRLRLLMSDALEQRRRHAELETRADLEVQTRHGQKLEALGRLSAGLAHEINTPIQFVGDNTRFLAAAYQTMLGLVVAQRDLLSGAGGPLSWDERRLAQAAAEQAADLEWLEAEVPAAVEQSLEGVERVASLVRAMKRFSYKQHDGAAPADLNDALRTTVTVASHETRYVADVVLSLEHIPLVHCSPGHLNQVFLNLIVNAADAIASTGRRGTIRLSTSLQGDEVLVEVSDDGPGVPAQIQDRIFEPFFTTKEVGKGTGQGLALARHVVEEQHRGRLELHCPPGLGTTFRLWLPVSGAPAALAASA